MLAPFFNYIAARITTLQDGIGNLLWNLWEPVKKVVTGFWGVVIIVAALAWEGLGLVGELTIDAFTFLAQLADGGWHNGIASPNAPGGLTNILAIANTFYPLDETLRYLAAMVTFVWLPIGLYRLVKSWIPTLSGA